MVFLFCVGEMDWTGTVFLFCVGEMDWTGLVRCSCSVLERWTLEPAWYRACPIPGQPNYC